MSVAPALDRVGNFAEFLGEGFDEAMTYAALRKAEAVGSQWVRYGGGYRQKAGTEDNGLYAEG